MENMIPGKKYTVNHGDTATDGIFEGVFMLGDETMLVFRLGSGIMRYISAADVSYIDSEPDPGSEETVQKDSGSLYYG